MSDVDDFIPVAGPSITDREVGYAAEAARTAWYQNHNVFNARFEALFAETVGVKHAVSLPHCTAGIHLALAARGIGAGDEVIVPDVTWIASVAPVARRTRPPAFWGLSQRFKPFKRGTILCLRDSGLVDIVQLHRLPSK